MTKNLLYGSIDTAWADHANVRYAFAGVLGNNSEVGDILNANTSWQQTSSVGSAFLRIGNG